MDGINFKLTGSCKLQVWLNTNLGFKVRYKESFKLYVLHTATTM